MGTWNYRVIKSMVSREELPETIRHIPNDEELVTFGIHEVHYNEDGTISGVAEKPATLIVSEVKDFDFFALKIPEAIRKPILQKIDGVWTKVP